MKKVLVTGGTGYIGSHTIIELYKKGYEIDVLDNLFNSKETVLDKIEEIAGKRPNFYEIDLTDFDKVEELLAKNQYDLVIHFAGLKAVGESVEKPLEYYENNVSGTINLLRCMQKHGVKKIIFSSSATVYGDPGDPKYTETMETGRNLANPYGRTKYMIEEILKDCVVADKDFEVVLLRYFNPIGNHSSGLIGEDPNGIPNNLMPIIMKVARGEIEELSVFGDDYPTPDGTCLRDYIHVVDLAKGHVAVIDKMEPGVLIYNLGSGKATSVLEMIKAFEAASGQRLPYKVAARREGDLAEFYADPSKAERELGWKTKLTIEDAMRDTLKFLEQN
ncbi:MAG: UDP-glucose 4-epimerase GalE [Candidatus Saccharibacteria bacterium]|nr:UDP-glucose 4-epimerase GalE [Candidatus Saccharibacteria bacterium]